MDVMITYGHANGPSCGQVLIDLGPFRPISGLSRRRLLVVGLQLTIATVGAERGLMDA